MKLGKTILLLFLLCVGWAGGEQPHGGHCSMPADWNQGQCPWISSHLQATAAELE